MTNLTFEDYRLQYYYLLTYLVIINHKIITPASYYDYTMNIIYHAYPVYKIC